MSKEISVQLDIEKLDDSELKEVSGGYLIQLYSRPVDGVFDQNGVQVQLGMNNHTIPSNLYNSYPRIHLSDPCPFCGMRLSDPGFGILHMVIQCVSNSNIYYCLGPNGNDKVGMFRM